MTMESQHTEIDRLIETIYHNYGYDFRNYARSSLARRIRQHQEMENIATRSELTQRVSRQPEFFSKFLLNLTVNVTEMFRDPSFFKSMRETVVPMLRRLPVIKIWHAGCSSGQEVYSMAILMEEEGLLDRCRIYGTDADEAVLQQAQKGVFPLQHMQLYTRNYRNAGGKCSFADYYTAGDHNALMPNRLKQQILFSHHNLAKDGVFADMDLIVCRNVLIYFDVHLQNRALTLFSESLRKGGILCLGSNETVRFSKPARHFRDLDAKERIYIKKNHLLDQHAVPPRSGHEEVINGSHQYTTG